jgi:GNAT superfamily N-acetyltransferase
MAEIRLLADDEVEAVKPLLLLAEPGIAALNWHLEYLSDAVYGMSEDGAWIGAASVGWKAEPSEILELAIATDRQGQGLGKAFLEWLVEEARRRGKDALVVGTSNASVDNILFYQRNGFRMDHVRPDYFMYYRKARYENGLRVRDMLVFRRDLTQDEETTTENG